tara:strand:- start:10502 stop:11218 length:717 start_codon:yes stop_codon:yes gene_type:complete
MLEYVPLNLKDKLFGSYFYIPCDTGYFNDFGKPIIVSAKEHAPEISVHFHIFDMTKSDQEFCNLHNISYTSEITPNGDDDFKKAFWVNIRFCRVPEIFTDNSYVMAIDVDSIFNDYVSLSEFTNDLSSDWVAMRSKGYGALGGCVGFTANGNGRYLLKEEIIKQGKEIGLAWFMDQVILDKLVDEKLIDTFTMKYVDYHCATTSKIWTGKGAKKYYRDNYKPDGKKNRFANAVIKYKE